MKNKATITGGELQLAKLRLPSSETSSQVTFGIN